MSGLRAIDLYAGVGGWALGLKLAGIDVVASYEYWEPAVRSHQANLAGTVFNRDIRLLSAKDIEKDLTKIVGDEDFKPDIVVGSPPCTQFSYSNRGGSGDIEDGLVDIRKFLEIVQKLGPKYWAMENVPRVEAILRRELQEGGALAEFSELFDGAQIGTYDMSEFGLPQRRRRCIAGNFDPRLLENYASRAREKNLGDVISALQSDRQVKDPIYNLKLSHNALTETENEEPLTSHEERYNREMKEHHPVYNNMAFPDPLERAVRTITATCTRVSRESVVIECPDAGGRFRRLNVRERASLQGFPIDFQFLGDSHSEKLKLVGNALPPLFAYYIAHALIGSKADTVKEVGQKIPKLDGVETPIRNTTPDTPGSAYPRNRSFRFAIKGLRFKSGMRFELRNIATDSSVDWQVGFHFGSSKDIRSVPLDAVLLEDILQTEWLRGVATTVKDRMAELYEQLEAIEFSLVQDAWRGEVAGIHPFELLDKLEESVLSLKSALSAEFEEAATDYVLNVCRRGYEGQDPIGERKLAKYAIDIVAGMIVGSVFNSVAKPALRNAA